MNKQLACLFLAAVVAPTAWSDVVIFQEGVSSLTGLPDETNGYQGTVDTEFYAGTPDTALGDMLGVSVDESSGGFPSQAALRFDNIFTDESGLVPRNEEILFAEIELSVSSDTDLGARISFNRVLGVDQNRTSGSGAWGEGDTWVSLGGEQEAVGDPPVLVGDKPIAVGASGVLGVSNEAIEAPESFDPSGAPRGILARELNVADLVELVRDGTKVTIDVTDSLQTWQAGAPNLGWAINNDTTGGWDFLSSEWHIDDIEDEDVPQFQFILDELGRESEQMRPLLRVVFGIDGDVNGNGQIDMIGTPGGDFELLKAGLGNTFADRGELGDLDFDRDVDLGDFSRFKAVYDAQFGAGAFAAALSIAPEPNAASLALLALASLAYRRRRPVA